MAYKAGGPSKLERIKLPRGVKVITFQSSELTARCPFRMEVDFYTVTIEYQPAERWGLEYVSVRRYLWSFRNKKVTGEALAKRIWRDVKRGIRPRWVVVTLLEKRGYSSQETKVGERR